MIYRYKDNSGQTVYSDQPPSASETSTHVDVIRNGVVVKSEAAQKDAHKEAKGYIKDARKHIPKALVYIEYIEYLRKHNPLRYQVYMRELMTNDPKSYTTLVRAGLFQPLQPHQRLSNVMDAGVGVMGDLFAGRSGAGTAATFAEKTLVDYMKKDGLMPDVLGSPSTLPKVVPQYSNTRLGQWSKMEDARMAKTGKELQAALAGRPVINAAATAATRVGGPVLDAMIGALDPAMVPGFSATIGLNAVVKNLERNGINLWNEEITELRGHLARKDWEAARNVIREAALRNRK